MIELETKLAFQDDLLEKLNQVVTEQQGVIDELSRKIKKVEDAVSSGQETTWIKDLSQEVPPPHY